MNWWQRVWRRTRLERELDAELRYHFDRRVEDRVRSGMSEEDARREAAIEFGGVEQVKEQCRDARGTRWLVNLTQDVRFAARLFFARERGFTALAVAALMLGIGVCNSFFIVVNAICVRGLPIEAADRVLYVSSRDARGREQGLSFGDFKEVRAASPSLVGVAAYATSPMAVGDNDRATDRVPGAYVSWTTFGLLREPTLMGRALLPEDDRPGAAPVALLGHKVWAGRYNADPAVVGRTIRVNGVPTLVVGVMREGFRFPFTADLWQPLALMPGLESQPRDARTLSVLGRMNDGATRGDTDADLSVLASRLTREYPATNRDVRFTAKPINDEYNDSVAQPVWIAFISAGVIVLLVACANVANLLLMRAVRRSQEITIRASLGASRGRIAGQLLVESAMLATVGGLAGLGLSLLGARLLSVTLSDSAPYWIHFTIDARGLLIFGGTCLGTVLIFGLAPAIHVSRTDSQELLHPGPHGGSAAPRARRWTGALVAAQFALTMVLLAVVLSGYRSLKTLEREQMVVEPSHLLTGWISLPEEKYRTTSERAAVFERLLERFRGTGTAAAASVASALPFGGAAVRPLEIAGRQLPPGQPLPNVSTVTIGGDYLEAIGAALLRGRRFDADDGTPGHEAAIVNERFVSMFLPGADPVGSRIRLADRSNAADPPWLEIVGVVPSVRQRPQGRGPDPVVYLPLRAAAPATVAVMLRDGSGSAADLLRTEMRAIDVDVPVYQVKSMQQVVTEARMAGRVSNIMVITIALIALALAAVGLYGVIGHGVAQKTHEIGLRMALGARPRQVVALVLRRAATQLAFGITAGVLCTVVWQRLLGDRTAPHRLPDPVALLMVIAVVVFAAILACLWPARRAAQLDPLVAIRRE